MEFNEKEAARLIELHNLSPKTLKVWKTRNAIPNKYAKNFKKRETGKAGEIKHDRFIFLLNKKTLNLSILADLAEIERNKISDAMRDIRLSDADLLKCLVEIKRLKLQISECYQTFSPMKLKKLFNNKLMIYTKIVENRQLADQISYVRNGKIEADRDLYNNTKNYYFLFAITLNI